MRVNSIVSKIQNFMPKGAQNAPKQAVQNQSSYLEGINFGKRKLQNDVLVINGGDTNNKRARNGYISKETTAMTLNASEKISNTAKLEIFKLKDAVQKKWGINSRIEEDAKKTAASIRKNTTDELMKFRETIEEEWAKKSESYMEIAEEQLGKTRVDNIMGSKQAIEKECAKSFIEMNDIKAKAYEDGKTVTDLFNKGAEFMPDGKPLRTIQDNLMVEFDKDGTTILRQTEFYNDGTPKEITEFDKNGKQDITSFDRQGILSMYKKGVEFIGEDIKLDKVVIGNCIMEGHEKTADGSLKTDKEVMFNNDEPAYYLEGFEKNESFNKIAKEMKFRSGKPLHYVEGYEFSYDNGSEKIAKEASFNKLFGNIMKYREGYEDYSRIDGTTKVIKEFDINFHIE